jgi:hypothetical protein
LGELRQRVLLRLETERGKRTGRGDVRKLEQVEG